MSDLADHAEQHVLDLRAMPRRRWSTRDKILLEGIAVKLKDTKKYGLLPDDLSIEPYAIALPRGDWALRLAVNTALTGIFGGSEIAFIYQTWFSPIGLQPGPLLSASFLLNVLPE